MDTHLNVTHIVFGGYVYISHYRYLLFVLMFAVYILIILCNCTIICLICIHRNLHEPMYIFIAALSLNSVFFSTVFYPKLLTDFVSERQTISYSACLFQYFMYYSLGGSDMLLLLVMSYDRYVSICKPLQYPTIMGKTTVYVLLGMAWFLPAVQLLVPIAMIWNKKLCTYTLKGVLCNNSVYMLYCGSSRALFIYGILGLLNVTVIPVLFILFTYMRIFLIAHRSSGEVKKKAAETCLPHLLVLICYSILCAYDIIIARVDSDLPKTVHLLMTLQVIFYNPLFNPVIYGLKMKEISKHLKKLFFRNQIK